MTEQEFQLIRSFIEDKAILLMQQEGKPFIVAGLDVSKHFEVNIEGRQFFIIATNVFYHIMNSVLVEACEKYPNSFGLRKTDIILDAIYNIEKVEPKERFSEFLRTEQFAWIVELENGKVSDNIIRVDLFRKDNKTDFTGGVFHAFKHFSYKGIPLSTHDEKNDINVPSDIFRHIIKCFFFENQIFTAVNKCYSFLKYNDKYNLRFDFHFEPATKVYFIDSIRKEASKMNSTQQGVCQNTG